MRDSTDYHQKVFLFFVLMRLVPAAQERLQFTEAATTVHHAYL